MSNGDGGGGGDPGIQLGGGDPTGGMPMGPGDSGAPPGLQMSSDDPEMGNAPEEGSATIHFHKHSHTKERHPDKPGHHRHHVHLKVHSIKFHNKSKPKVSKSDIAQALAQAGPPGGGDGGGGEPPSPPGPPPQGM